MFKYKYGIDKSDADEHALSVMSLFNGTGNILFVLGQENIIALRDLLLEAYPVEKNNE